MTAKYSVADRELLKRIEVLEAQVLALAANPVLSPKNPTSHQIHTKRMRLRMAAARVQAMKTGKTAQV